MNLLTKEEQIQQYGVYKQRLAEEYPILLKKLSDLGLQASDIDSKIADAVATLKGGAGADSDTLKELADKIVANSLDDVDLTQTEVDTAVGV